MKSTQNTRFSDKLWNYLQEYANKHKAKGKRFWFPLDRLERNFKNNFTRYFKDGSEILIPTRRNKSKKINTKRMCKTSRLSDSYIIPVSDNQTYKQFGNSVTVPLIQAVGKQLVKSLLAINEPAKSQKAVY